jgi:hypothetical protein
MSTKSEFSIVGLAHKFLLAAEAQGYTPELLNELAENQRLLRGMLNVQLGRATISYRVFNIDCSADPFIPKGWEVVEHRRTGLFSWVAGDSDMIAHYFSLNQAISRRIVGHELRKELEDKPVLNANILDFLLNNPKFIPEEWKERNTFFWGTIYRNPIGNLCVRYLHWGGRRWLWGSYELGDHWRDDDPAAISAGPLPLNS